MITGKTFKGIKNGRKKLNKYENASRCAIFLFNVKTWVHTWSFGLFRLGRGGKGIRVPKKTLILKKTENQLDKLRGPFVTYSENKQKFVCFPDSFLKHKKYARTMFRTANIKHCFSQLQKIEWTGSIYFLLGNDREDERGDWGRVWD